MFAVQEISVEVPFETAAIRLVGVLHNGTLNGVCEGAYEGGLSTVLRVGPRGEAGGISKLVRVCFLEPVRRGSTLTAALRWEATGVAGDLFPVLDADVSLSPQGEDRTLLRLTGSYRPPFGLAGALLDRAIMHRLADATIRSLLEGLSATLTEPVPRFQPEWAVRPCPVAVAQPIDP